MNITQDVEELFREGLSVAELGNIFMSMNNSSIRQIRSPLSLSHFESTGSGLTVELCDSRHHIHLSIPKSEYDTLQSPILHNHDYFELMFILSGTLKIQIEDTIYTYQEGDTCLFDRNIHHAEVQQQNTSIIYCCITKAFLDNWPNGSTAYDLSDSKCLLHFFKNSENAPGSSNRFAEFRNANARGVDKIHSLLHFMRAELLQQEPGSWLIICGLFLPPAKHTGRPQSVQIPVRHSEKRKSRRSGSPLHRVRSGAGKPGGNLRRHALQQRLPEPGIPPAHGHDSVRLLHLYLYEKSRQPAAAD